MRRYKSRHFSRALTCEAESKHRQQLDRGCMQQNSVHDTEWCKPDKYKVWIKSLQDEVCRDESRIQTEDNVDTRLSGLCVSCQLLSVLFVNWVETNKLLRFTHFLHFMPQFLILSNWDLLLLNTSQILWPNYVYLAKTKMLMLRYAKYFIRLLNFYCKFLLQTLTRK